MVSKSLKTLPRQTGQPDMWKFDMGPGGPTPWLPLEGAKDTQWNGTWASPRTVVRHHALASPSGRIRRHKPGKATNKVEQGPRRTIPNRHPRTRRLQNGENQPSEEPPEPPTPNQLMQWESLGLALRQICDTVLGLLSTAGSFWNLGLPYIYSAVTARYAAAAQSRRRASAARCPTDQG